jgi:hypothetical protein
MDPQFINTFFDELLTSFSLISFSLFFSLPFYISLSFSLPRRYADTDKSTPKMGAGIQGMGEQQDTIHIGGGGRVAVQVGAGVTQREVDAVVGAVRRGSLTLDQQSLA